MSTNALEDNCSGPIKAHATRRKSMSKKIERLEYECRTSEEHSLRAAIRAALSPFLEISDPKLGLAEVLARAVSKLSMYSVRERLAVARILFENSRLTVVEFNFCGVTLHPDDPQPDPDLRDHNVRIALSNPDGGKVNLAVSFGPVSSNALALQMVEAGALNRVLFHPHGTVHMHIGDCITMCIEDAEAYLRDLHTCTLLSEEQRRDEIESAERRLSALKALPYR